MQNSPNEDQDQRKNNSMEDSTAMTIEFLRARLLSERSVSRTARQRAEELAKRVVELEEQLKIVYLQRKKAEKAAADVLTILENHGMSDVSEEFDSSSDQEETLRESMVGNNSVKEETSASVKVRRNDMEAFSGSELESSPLSGRSLSWKSGKECLHSLEKKKYTDSSRRRRCSFASTGSSSPKCVGKSCRQIRRRETRSAVEGLQIDPSVIALQSEGVATCSEGFPNGSDIGPETSREGSENLEERDFLEGPVSVVSENQRVTNGRYLNGHGGDKDMERALEHQAKLIGRYEAEEKAQREWEEKFRENNNCTPDSCDPGNHSDVTEERDEIKAPAPPAGTITSQNQEAKLEVEDVCFSKDSKTHSSFQPPPHVDMGCLQDQKSSSVIPYESSASEFAFPMANGKHDHDRSENYRYPPLHSAPNRSHLHGSPGHHSAHISSSHAGSSLCKEAASGSGKELALMPQETSGKLGSVLEALQQAKSSLNHKLKRLPLIEGGSVGEAIEPSVPAMRTGERLALIEGGSVGKAIEPSVHAMRTGDRLALIEGGSVGKAIEPSVPAMRTGDRLETPIGCAGLFRLPTDFQFEATARANFLGSGSRLSLGSYSPEPAGDKFFSTPYMESRSSASAGDRFITMPTNPYSEIRSVVPMRTPVFEGLTSFSGHTYHDLHSSTGLPSSGKYTYPDPHLSTGLPSSSKYSYPTYPFYPDLMPRLPSNEGLSRPLPSREVGMPPATQFSYNDDHIRPNMYR